MAQATANRSRAGQVDVANSFAEESLTLEPSNGAGHLQVASWLAPWEMPESIEEALSHFDRAGPGVSGPIARPVRAKTLLLLEAGRFDEACTGDRRRTESSGERRTVALPDGVHAPQQARPRRRSNIGPPGRCTLSRGGDVEGARVAAIDKPAEAIELSSRWRISVSHRAGAVAGPGTRGRQATV